MALIETVACAAIALAGLYLFAFGAAALTMPTRTHGFLLGFVSSRSLHFVELALRLAIGASLALYAPRMLWPGVFHVFGWVLLGTTTMLLVAPWRWHQRLAQQTVPRVGRYIRWIGLTALAIGAVMLVALVVGSAS